MKRNHRKNIREHVMRRDGGFCFHCGKPAERPTMDHVHTRGNGGRFAVYNLVLSCYMCNHERGSRTLSKEVRAMVAIKTSEYFANR